MNHIMPPFVLSYLFYINFYFLWGRKKERKVNNNVVQKVKLWNLPLILADEMTNKPDKLNLKACKYIHFNLTYRTNIPKGRAPVHLLDYYIYRPTFRCLHHRPIRIIWERYAIGSTVIFQPY